MSQPLLLDEMFPDDIARQLRAKGYDVISVVADPALAGLPGDQGVGGFFLGSIIALVLVAAVLGVFGWRSRHKRLPPAG